MLQDRFHHPKEDAYLFRLLRRRHSDAVPLIEQLESEHRVGAQKIRTLEQALARYRAGGTGEFSAFAEAVQAYASFHWDHMRAEEERLLPLVRPQAPDRGRLEGDRRCLPRQCGSALRRIGQRRFRSAVPAHRHSGAAADRRRSRDRPMTIR